MIVSSDGSEWFAVNEEAGIIHRVKDGLGGSYVACGLVNVSDLREMPRWKAKLDGHEQCQQCFGRCSA